MIAITNMDPVDLYQSFAPVIANAVPIPVAIHHDARAASAFAAYAVTKRPTLNPVKTKYGFLR